MTSSDTFDTSTYTRKPTDVIDLTDAEDHVVKSEHEDDSKVTAQSEDEDVRRADLSRRILQPDGEAVDPSVCMHTPPPKARWYDVGMMSPPSVGRCTLTPMKPLLGFG